MPPDVLGNINPWLGTLATFTALGLAYLRLRFRFQQELEAHTRSEAAKEAADRSEFRRTLLEHVAYVEDKRRKTDERLTEMDRTHRAEMAEMQGRLDEAHKRHMECEERFLALIKGANG